MISSIERRSVRTYLNKDVEEEKLLEILKSAQAAPSGSNTQPWNFILVKSEEKKEEITKADYNQVWMKSAPIFIVCVADIRCRIKSEEEIVLDENTTLPELKMIIRDCAIAIEHMLLEAEEQGLSSCWTGWYEQESMREILHIPSDKYVCGVITLGYSEEINPMRPRRDLKEMIRYETWE